MSNTEQPAVSEYRCGSFTLRLRYVKKEDGYTYVADAYLKPVRLEEVSIIASFFADKRIFWNLGEDGSLKLLLNLRVENPQRFEEDFMSFLTENIPTLKTLFSLNSLVQPLLDDGWLVHTGLATLEASKTIPGHGRLEIRVTKTGPTRASLQATLVLFPESLAQALTLTRRLREAGYNVKDRFPVLRADKVLGTFPVCDLTEKIRGLYEEATRLCASHEGQ